jgi:hypothetical protein
MYDAVVAANIPTRPVPTLVAGYDDQIVIPPWTAPDWARFPHSILVRIVKKASSVGLGRQVLDVERGDATPAQAPGWVIRQRALAQDPTVYCDLATWPDVIAAFTAAKVGQPHYWVAHYDGFASLPTMGGITAVAHQYTNGKLFDTSVVADVWPGVDKKGPTVTDLQNTDPTYVDLCWDAQAVRANSATVGGTGSNAGAQNGLAAQLAAISNKLDILLSRAGGQASSLSGEATVVIKLAPPAA